MTYKHKLAVRVPLLRDTLILVPLVALLACEKPAGLTGPGPVVQPPPPLPPASHAGHYVTASGSAGGDGSSSRPWDLATALSQPAAVLAGDTIWLRGGTYRGNFTSNLRGSANAPIILRQYPGERATI